RERVAAWWRDHVPAAGAAWRPVPLAAGMAAGAVLLLGAASTQPALRSFAQDVLQQFRVERVKPVRIDVAAMNSLPPIDESTVEALFKSGTYSGPTDPEVRAATVAEAASATGLALRGPSRLPAQAKGGPTAMVSEPINFTFTYDGQKLADVAQELGVDDAALLAQLQAADGVTVKGNIPAAAALIYGDPFSAGSSGASGPAGATGSANGSKPLDGATAASAEQTMAPFLAIVQLKSPTLDVPNDVNVERLRREVLESDAIPRPLANQLLGIADWQRTLPIPLTRGTARDVPVDGVTGSLITGEGPGPMLVWQKGGALYIMGGVMISEQDLLTAAASLAPVK
ncbi:MAG: hypothetical protein ACRDJN_08245, partial [Chloroflexota bacterium]